MFVGDRHIFVADRHIYVADCRIFVAYRWVSKDKIFLIVAQLCLITMLGHVAWIFFYITWRETGFNQASTRL